MSKQQSQSKKLILVFGIFFILIIIIIIWLTAKKPDMISQENFVFQPILENDNVPTAQEKQLVKAAWGCDEETITKLLLDSKLSIDSKNEFGTTALMAVSQIGCVDLVKLLVEKYKANVNIKNFYNRSALMLADYSSFDIMKTLLSNGADVHIKNKCCDSTTLMLVAGSYDNYIDVVKLLIEYGADVNAKDKDGKTAIIYAQKNNPDNKKDIIQLLIEKK